ncbi:hypothetical protein AOLI_G00014190 [Acnodon oligacanthus]
MQKSDPRTESDAKGLKPVVNGKYTEFCTEAHHHEPRVKHSHQRLTQPFYELHGGPADPPEGHCSSRALRVSDLHKLSRAAAVTEDSSVQWELLSYRLLGFQLVWF